MFKISSIKPANVVLTTLAVLLVINVHAVSAQEKPALNRSTLLSNKLELPSKNVDARVIRVIIPPAFKTPWHTHEGPGPRYVVKGTLEVVEGGKTNTYSAGEVFWESGQLMSVENKGEAAAELIIFELAPAK
jgi:quercetin dioxygenase-like cupin family protein